MHMNRLFRFFLLFTGLLLTLPLQAERVGPAQAQDAARAFFRNDRNPALRLSPLREIRLASAPLTKAGEAEPAFYIFNREGGGFVIISGDDACQPVLAYSFTNRFGTGADMPDGLRTLLSQYEGMVGQARSGRLSRSERVASAWATLMAQTKAGSNEFQPEMQLITPRWGQGEPFNRLAPVVDGERAVAGCVPLAMAMIMRFHTWPACGEGTLDSYGYSIKSGTSMTIPAIELGYPYDWDKIRYEYPFEDEKAKTGPQFTEEEADAVARLVYDCGVAAHASFDNTTSANTGTMAASAVDHFSFDPSAIKYERAFFTDEAWIAILKQEIQTRPVLYSAYREDSDKKLHGHAFLLDGYDKSDKFSINWGWSGDSNGFYELSDFSPSGSRQYVRNHSAVIGLKPMEGGQEVEYLYLSGGTASSGTVYSGLSTSGTIETGKSFSLVVGFLHNGGKRPFKGVFNIALLDAEEQIKELVSQDKEIELAVGQGTGWSSISCLMNRYPVEGDHLSLVYRSQEWAADDWQLPLCSREGGTTNSLAVQDTRTLAEVTGINYSKTSQELTIRTKDDVVCELTGPTGAAVTEGIQQELTRIVCKTADLPKGTYKLTLKRGSDSVVLTLKMGNK